MAKRPSGKDSVLAAKAIVMHCPELLPAMLWADIDHDRRVMTELAEHYGNVAHTISDLLKGPLGWASPLAEDAHRRFSEAHAKLLRALRPRG